MTGCRRIRAPLAGALAAEPDVTVSSFCPVRLRLTSTTSDMVASPRISDHELAAINAAAVTREYNVKPHLGEDYGQEQRRSTELGPDAQTTGRFQRSTGEYLYEFYSREGIMESLLCAAR